MKIIVEGVFPPIPDRSRDFRATLDDYEPGDPQGWGKTAIDAIEDLADQWEDRSRAIPRGPTAILAAVEALPPQETP
jgi:hypothetical protein